MPKLKTKKALAKRINVTKSKRKLRSKAGKRHLLSSKTAKRKRKLRKKKLVSDAQRVLIQRALPYSV